MLSGRGDVNHDDKKSYICNPWCSDDLFGVIVILNPVLGLGVIGVLIGCGVITAGVNLIYLGCSPWIL